jgi:hypothetical protein
MIAPDLATPLEEGAARERIESPLQQTRAPGIVPSQRPLSKAVQERLFGPVAFASGLPTRFREGWRQ